MRSIAVQPASLEKLSSLLTETRADRLTASAQRARSPAAGGIQDQIVDGSDWLLLPDPYEPARFARRLHLLLDDLSLTAAMGSGHASESGTISSATGTSSSTSTYSTV
jgi:hypothetical protein